MKIEPVKNKKKGGLPWILLLFGLAPVVMEQMIISKFRSRFLHIFSSKWIADQFWLTAKFVVSQVSWLCSENVVNTIFLARGSSATNWKTSNTQFTAQAPRFFHHLEKLRALHPVFWKCSTANSGAKHRSHIFVFVKSSWSANNRNELQVTKLAW